MSKDLETIIAQCTPTGNGAIALLRLSGASVRDIVSKISKLPQGKQIETIKSGTVHFGWITGENKEHVDQVMFIVLDGPKTFTGENIIEITCHNNQFLIQEIINLAIKHGARLAHEGEFSKRAFLNDKIDLIQAEAINELIHANTQLALKKSLAQLEGSFSNSIAKIETELVRTLAWCEASFEFLDEEEEFGTKMHDNLQELAGYICQLKQAFDAQQQIRQGIRISIIGSVNAGKSSLFNALLASDRAIVTDIAGTTRDVIEAGVYRNGNYWTLIDTAGLRQTEDIIEREGIRKSFEEAQKSDIILLVYDSQRALYPDELKVYQEIIEKYPDKIILVKNKSDLPTFADHQLKNHVATEFSSKTKNNLITLQNIIEQKIANLFSEIQSPFLLNKRHFSILLDVEKKLQNIMSMLSQPAIQYELVSYSLRDTLENLSELTGKSVSEAGLDMVFKEFCVGK